MITQVDDQLRGRIVRSELGETFIDIHINYATIEIILESINREVERSFRTGLDDYIPFFKNSYVR